MSQERSDLSSEVEQKRIIDTIVYYFQIYYDEIPHQEQIDWFLNAIKEGHLPLNELETHFLTSPAYHGAKIKKHGCVYTIFGTKMYLRKNDKYISRDIATYYCWEPDETKFLGNYIKKGMNVVDIGANIGYYTLLFSKWVNQEGKVFSFEPDPDNFQLILKNIEANQCKNITALNKAISNNSGPTFLYLSEDNNFGDHRLTDAFPYEINSHRKKIEIESIKLDDFFSIDKKIDLIKMDIQGSEILALNGMNDVINNNKKLAIFTEFWPYAIEKTGFSPKESFEKLVQMGFSISILNNGKKEKMTIDSDLLHDYTTYAQANLFCEK